MSIENTSNNPRFDWVLGQNPEAIERQESKGQEELVSSSQLPRKTNIYQDVTAEECYDNWGIKIIGESEGDDLFYDVKLPEGWKIEKTEHPMWNELIDSEGNVKGKIFYKAAFYDRDAFINIQS